MNVKQLKEQLIGIPDDAVVVIDEHDGWFKECAVELTKAADTGEGQFIGPNYSSLWPKLNNKPVLLFT